MLRTDGRGDVLMASNVLRKLSGRTILWRRTPDPAMAFGDVGGDAQGRVIIAGGWTRPCTADEPCNAGGTRTIGFVRSSPP